MKRDTRRLKSCSRRSGTKVRARRNPRPRLRGNRNGIFPTQPDGATDSYLGLLLGRSFLVDPRALSRRGARAARKSRGIAPHAVSGRCTRRIDSTRARREPRARPAPRAPRPAPPRPYPAKDTAGKTLGKHCTQSLKKNFFPQTPAPPFVAHRAAPPHLPPRSPPQ